ncbi:MAG TPA: hypothetical protein VFM18_17230 [Methanosarcina sp.]|nr:hypothetical protein [Methanosarcina sp.]
MRLFLYEGGNVFDNTDDVAKDDVATVVSIIKQALPSGLRNHVMADIGSAGYKVASGDIDLFLDQDAVISNFDVANEKEAKQALAKYFQSMEYQVAVKGRNVHVDVPYRSKSGKELHAQVDLMVIPNAESVADWHQHGPRGSYEDPGFKANHLYILLNSIGKFLGLKVDAFGGTVMRRDDNEVVANNRDAAAKLLLNPKATASDLNSVASVMKALANDPDKEGKLAQAKQDQAKGLLTLPEEAAPGTAAWFRKMGQHL